MTTRFFYSKNPFVDNLARLHQIVSPKMLQIMSGDYRTSLLAGLYRCWFVYVREKYCWLVHMDSVHVRGLALPAPAEHADVGSLVVTVGAVPIPPCATNGTVTGHEDLENLRYLMTCPKKFEKIPSTPLGLIPIPYYMPLEIIITFIELHFYISYYVPFYSS